MKDLIRNIKIYDDASLQEAVETLCTHNINGAGVCDKDNKLVGFISAKDLLKRIYANKYHNLPTGFVKDCMSLDVVSINDSMNTPEMITKFIDYKYHYYPVIDRNNNYLGTIYRKDLLKYVGEFKASTW